MPKVPVDTPTGITVGPFQPLYDSIMIYTFSSLVEQTTPVVFAFFDADDSASSVGFVDQDLDPFQLGGTAG